VQFTVTCSYPLPPCLSFPLFLLLLSLFWFLLVPDSLFFAYPSFLMVHCRPWGGCYWKPAWWCRRYVPLLVCSTISHGPCQFHSCFPLSSILLRNVNPHFLSHMKGRKSWISLYRNSKDVVCWLVLIGKIKKLCKESYNELFRRVCMHVTNTCMHLYAKRIDQWIHPIHLFVSCHLCEGID